MKKFFKLFQAVLLTVSSLTLASVIMACSDGGTTSPKRVAVTEISIEPVAGKYVAVGKTLQLDANVLPLNATINEVFWTSSDETMATVDEDGVVHAVSKVHVESNTDSEDDQNEVESREAAPENNEEENEEEIVLPENAVRIRATSISDPEVFADFIVYIVDEVIYSDKLILTGRTATFKDKTFVITSSWGETVPTDTTIIWTSSDETKLVVDEDGRITALDATEEGVPVVVTAKAYDGGARATHSIYISEAPVALEEVELTAEDVFVDSDENPYTFIGTVLALTPVFTPANASNQTVTYEITNSEPEDLATLDPETGILTVKDENKTGTITVTLTTVKDEDLGDDDTWEEKTATYTLNINRPVSGITVSSSDYDETFGIPVTETPSSATFTVSVTPADATDKSVEWISSDETIATVDENGVVTAVSEGEVTITARAKDGSEVEGTFDVVTYIPVESITLTTESGETEFVALTTEQLVVTVVPENATYKQYSFSTSSGVTVDAETLVATFGDGESTPSITATSVQGELTSTVNLTVKLDNTGLAAAITTAETLRGTIDDSDITTDVTEAGSYLKDVVDDLDTSVTAAKAVVNGASQGAINSALADLTEKTENCKPIDLYAPKALNAERVTGIVISSDTTVTSNLKANLNGNGNAVPPNYTNIYDGTVIDESVAKITQTKDGRNVYLMNISENKYFNFQDFANMKASEGFYNAAHFSVLTSADFEIGFYRYGDDQPGPYLFHFDVNNKKTFLKDKDSNLTEVDSTWSRDENLWYNIDVNFTSVYRAPDLIGPIVNIVFASATGADRYFLDNVYFYEAEYSSEYFVKKLESAIASAESLISSVKVGTKIGNIAQADKDAFATAIATAKSVVSTDKTVLSSAVETLNNAITDFKAAIIKLSFIKTTVKVEESEWENSIIRKTANKTITSNSGDGNLAFDASYNSIWDGGTDEPVWLAVAFESPIQFNVIKLLQEGAFSDEFAIQISDDGTTWVNLIEETVANHIEYQNYELNMTVETKYVRFFGKSAGTQWGQKIREFGLYHETVESQTALFDALVDEINTFVAGVAIGDENGEYPASAKETLENKITEIQGQLAGKDVKGIKALMSDLEDVLAAFKLTQKGVVKSLITEAVFKEKAEKSIAKGKQAYASSSNGTSTPSMAVDGNVEEPRWAAATLNDNEWLYVDLGASKEFNQIGIKWEGAFASKYTILYTDTIPEAGQSEADWKTLITVSDINTRETVLISINPSVSARYIKINLDKAGTAWNTSFYEMFIVKE